MGDLLDFKATAQREMGLVMRDHYHYLLRADAEETRRKMAACDHVLAACRSSWPDLKTTDLIERQVLADIKRICGSVIDLLHHIAPDRHPDVVFPNFRRALARLR